MDAMAIQEGRIAEKRKSLYGLLAYIYNVPPSVELIDSIREQTTARLIRGVSSDAGCALTKFLDHFDGNIKPLKQDFMDLFMVPTKKYLAPYESVYVDDPVVIEGVGGKKCTFGASTQAVMAFYEHVGLRVSTDYKELPDFIGLELACMEYLCAKEVEFGDEGKIDLVNNTTKMARIFLERHLTKWTSQLVEKMMKNSGTEFYKSIAVLTKDVISGHFADIASDIG